MSDFFKGMIGHNKHIEDEETSRLNQKQRQDASCRRALKESLGPRPIENDPRWLQIMRKLTKPGTEY